MHPAFNHVGAPKSAPRRPAAELSDWILAVAWFILVLSIVAVAVAWAIVLSVT